ncbi:MAG: hypothetical protein HY231_27215 [Acidobacteria bacterium]|nr:hypothetical protein [Acidobacteriota bacterium]
MQGERPALATFKKEDDKYTDAITGLRGDPPLKKSKVEGDKVIAKAEIETSQGNFVNNYTFTLQGDSLKEQGVLDFNASLFTFDIALKRAADETATPATQASTAPRPQPQIQGQAAAHKHTAAATEIVHRLFCQSVES